MENDCLDICLSDGLPCSCHVKGVGIGLCVKRFRDAVIVCCRFSDASIFEHSPNIQEDEEWLTRSEIDKRLKELSLW